MSALGELSAEDVERLRRRPLKELLAEASGKADVEAIRKARVFPYQLMAAFMNADAALLLSNRALSRWADRIAYVCHDFEDAVATGVVTEEQQPALVRDRCGTARREQLGAFIYGMIDAAAELEARLDWPDDELALQGDAAVVAEIDSGRAA